MVDGETCDDNKTVCVCVCVLLLFSALRWYLNNHGGTLKILLVLPWYLRALNKGKTYYLKYAGLSKFMLHYHSECSAMLRWWHARDRN